MIIEFLFILAVAGAMAWCIGAVVASNRKKMWRYDNPEAYDRMVAGERKEANKQWIGVLGALLLMILICGLLALAGGCH